jgi:hypothetical protein
MAGVRFPLAVLLALALAGLAPAQDKPRKVAFLVGVGHYDHNFKSLGTAPVNDVTELAKVLKAGGFEVVLLTSQENKKDEVRATKANILQRFDAAVKGAAGAPGLTNTDTLLVVLCGHGVQANVPNISTGRTESQPFFCPADGKMGETATLVPVNNLIHAASAQGATSLFLIDACREATDPNRGTRGIEGKQVVLPKNTAILFACGQEQLSHQSEKAGGGHGLFTFAVLKTLRGETGAKEEVDWNGLVSSVQKEFETGPVKGLLPPGAAQAPVAAAGELGYTRLVSLKPPADDKSGPAPETLPLGSTWTGTFAATKKDKKEVDARATLEVTARSGEKFSGKLRIGDAATIGVDGIVKPGGVLVWYGMPLKKGPKDPPPGVLDYTGSIKGDELTAVSNKRGAQLRLKMDPPAKK